MALRLTSSITNYAGSASVSITLEYYGNGVSHEGVSSDNTCTITFNGKTETWHSTFTKAYEWQTMGTKTFSVTKTQKSQPLTASGKMYDKYISATTGGWNGSGTITTSASIDIGAKDSYTISYNNNGHGTAPAAQTKWYNETLTLQPAITATGYTFGGWNTKANGTGTNYSAKGSYTSNSGTTLYAKWSTNTYSITYNANNGTGSMANTTYTYAASGTINLRTNSFTRTGYSFQGWASTEARANAGNVDYTNGQAWNLNNADNYILWAVWSPEVYTITLDNQSATSGGTSTYYEKYNTGNYTTSACTTTISTITKPTRTGYTFNGYYSAVNGGGTQYIDANGTITANNTAFSQNTIIYAKWTPYTYIVKYNANGGTGTMSSSTHTYDISKALTANTFERTNYSFRGWATSLERANAEIVDYVDKRSVLNLTDTNGATVNLYAVWHLDQVRIVYHHQNGDADTYSDYITPGQSITVKNNSLARTGYTQQKNGTDVGWFSAASGGTFYKNGTNVTLTEILHLYAQWVPVNYTIKFSLNNPLTADGYNTVPTSINNITKTYDIPLNTGTLSNGRIPNPTRRGYTFTGWKVGSTSTIISPSSPLNNEGFPGAGSNLTLTAQWTVNQVTVTLDANGKGTINAYSTGWDGSGTIVTETRNYGANYGNLPNNQFIIDSSFASLYGKSGWFTAREGGTKLTTTTPIYYINEENPRIYFQLQQIRKYGDILDLKVVRCDENGTSNPVGTYMKVSFTRIPSQQCSVGGTLTNIDAYTVKISWQNRNDSTNKGEISFDGSSTSTDASLDNTFEKIVGNGNLLLKTYDVIVEITDLTSAADNSINLPFSKTTFLSSGSLLLDGFKDSDFKFIASREDEGRKVWFRTDITPDGQTVFLNKTCGVPGDYIFTKASSNWTLNGTTTNPYNSYGLNYNDNTLSLQVGETITVHSPGNYIQVALGGVADNKFYNIPINKQAVKLYGSIYTQHGIIIGNPTVEDNLINVETNTLKYSIPANGTPSANNSFNYTDYISVEENNQYILKIYGVDNANIRVHGYDSNQNWQQQLIYFYSGTQQEVSFIIPSGISYVRISYPIAAQKTTKLLTNWNGDTQVNGDLYVRKGAIIGHLVNKDGFLQINGNEQINGSLEVDGNINITSGHEYQINGQPLSFISAEIIRW